jgi:serine/threonine-protein kinase
VIENKYRIDSVLGQGGMGTVYRATRLMIGDEVAVKVLHTDHLTDSQAIARFRREAQAAARLKHPNVVAIYDFSILNDGTAYLIMEFVEGRSLRRFIDDEAPVNPQLAADIISQVAAALDEAHHHNIVHRDLKPDNIIITESAAGMRVKVLDFGIAKMRDVSASAGSLTQTGTLIGTPHYMSPEQCMGEELDGRSDIYSLGVVLYEMLTASVPFNAGTTTAIILQHVTAHPPPVRERNGNVSPAIERVVMDALEKDRTIRPQSAGELARELIAALSRASDIPPQPRKQAQSNEAPTLKTNRAPQPALDPTRQFQQQQPRMFAQPPQKKSRAGLIAVSVIAIIVLLGGFTAVYFFLIKKKQSVNALGSANNTQSAAMTNTTNNSNATNRPVNINVNLPPTNQSQTNQAQTNQTNQQGNLTVAREQVAATLQRWIGATKQHNLEAHLSHYADLLDVYYMRTNVTKDFVRENKARAYNLYDTMDAGISNVVISVDATGARAIATFDKWWSFSGNGTSSGSVQQRLWLANVNGRWLITGEKDLKVYPRN